jgi:predicted ribosome quality control (RQC) complex YloA/Tae2 family protein
MPCRDYIDDNPSAYFGPQLKKKDDEIDRLQKKLSFAESALCATLRAIENAGINIYQPHKSTSLDSPMIDWKNAGITSNELYKWFENHKKVDAAIRAKIAKQKQEALLKQKKENEILEKKNKALKKLSKEERQILGIKE